jgi:hypothetical protein
MRIHMLRFWRSHVVWHGPREGNHVAVLVEGSVAAPRMRLLTIASVVLGLAALLSDRGVAAPQDYRFELASPATKSGKAIVLKIRLIHVPDGKPVTDAIIIQTKFDMDAADGMAAMTAPPKAVPTSEPGIYQFEVGPSMSGNWKIGLSAKVQGEAETVSGSVTVAVPK